jgi:D-alanine--poly(phosphoribitol) ligase subunit 2
MTTLSRRTDTGSSKADAISGFIEERFLVSFSDGTLSVDSDLFEGGVIDSFGVVELVSFIQDEFGVALETDDLMSPLLASVSGLVELIEQKGQR